ncbi:helix-turn-helix domain-containing protein [Streptomyces sp. NPDC086010]|uniref:helix-turn-helix domain-containing protein n=1 Tax=Streptomyces sp. NPDC086010 TaxID=3365745 RepID=UPI0037D1949D
MAERVRVRGIDDDEGQRLLQIIRRGSGSVVTWRRAQMVLLSAQGMDVAKVAEVTFSSPDRVREVIHNFNADGFASLYPKYEGGRPRTFTLPERREIKKIAKSKPALHGLPFSTWSLVKLADFLVAEGVVDDISHEGLRTVLREEGVTVQRGKTWKSSNDPNYEAKKARVEHLYAIADGEVIPEPSEPEVILCMDEFGPLNLRPHPGRQWAERGGKGKDPDREPRPRRRATYTRPHGVRHLFAAYDLGKDQLYGHPASRQPRLPRAGSAGTCRWTTAIRVHQHAAGARKAPPAALPRRGATGGTNQVVPVCGNWPPDWRRWSDRRVSGMLPRRIHHQDPPCCGGTMLAPRLRHDTRTLRRRTPT